MGGLHSGETGPSEMLMELVYRLAAETSPLISQIRNNVYVSVTPVADADGRDRNVDWFYKRARATARAASGGQPGAAGARRTRRRRHGAGVPYWGKYVYHDNNRDINLSQMQMRAITRLVLHRASADHARPARIAAAALHLQRRSAAEPEPRSAPLRRAALLLELGAGADDEVGHAGRVHARVHGRLVAGLPRLASPTTTTA